VQLFSAVLSPVHTSDNVAGVDGALRCNIFGRRRMLLARPTFVTLLANGKVGRIAGSVAVTNKCILTL